MKEASMVLEERILAELQEIKNLLKSMASGTPGPVSESPGTIAGLGWTPEQAALVRAQLASFEEDWNAPGMEAYDRL
jgi:hypothetical protein